MGALPPMRWDGEALVPLPAFAKRADDALVVGEVYRLEEVHDRSAKSHRHYFAAINEAWMNLPETMADRFPTSEHLRKFALIKAGYRDERTLVASSKAEARRIAAFVKPSDEFAIVTVHEAAVTIYTAKSQSVKAMGKKVFQESKTAVMDILASMIGTPVEDLRREAA